MPVRSRINQHRLLSRLVRLLLCVDWLMLIALIPAIMVPDQAQGQSQPALEIDVIELWVRGGIPPQRMWDRYVSKQGLAFMMDGRAEMRLRSAGATDEMIAMLRRAAVTQPSSRTGAVLSDPRPATTAPAHHHYTRAELAPLYFGREVTLLPFISVANLKMTSGSSKGFKYYAPNDTTLLHTHTNPSFRLARRVCGLYSEALLRLTT